MGTCSICGSRHVDTISGVCGQCIGRNRRRNRQQKNIMKIIGISIGVIVAGFFVYQNLSTIENKASQTQELIVKQVPNLTASISEPIKSTAPQIIKTVNTITRSTPQITKPTISISRLEQKVHDGINAERQKQGLVPLVYDTKISDIARGHSQDMESRNYFEHDTPEGLTASQRGINAGYQTCGNRQAIQDSQEYGRLTKQFEATGNTDQSLYNQLQILYNKVESENQNNMLFLGFAENIEQNNLYDSTEYIDGIPFYHWLSEDQLASSVVDVWMNSPGHRANILTPAFYSEGIGIALANNDEVYITEDFC